MRIWNEKNQPEQISRMRTSLVLFPLVVVCLSLSSPPALANGLDTAISLATRPYAVLKRASVACGQPIEQHVLYKEKMLAILAGVPDVDISAANTQIEKAYQMDADLGGLDCTEPLQDNYKQIIARGVDRDLENLEREVRTRQSISQ